MKFLSNKKIKLIIYGLLIVFVDFFNQDTTSGMIVVFTQAVLAVMLIYTIYSMIMDRFRKSEEKIKNAIGRFIVKLFGPLSKRIVYGAHKKSSFVVGSSKFEFMGRFERPKKKAKRIRPKKLSLDDCEGNADTVRKLYIKYILSSITRGKDYTHAETPFEIENKIENDDVGVLFDSYVDARYNDSSDIDDEIVQKCRDIVG